MPKVVTTEMQQHGAFSNGFGLYDMRGGFGGSIRLGSLGAGCPEGARMVNGECECYPGRVWMPDNSRCVSPQSPAYTGAITLEESKEGHTPDTYGQQDLTGAARTFLQQAGFSIECQIDPNWASGPQGGEPSRVCRVKSSDGPWSPYQFGAYAINLNPRGAITDYYQWKAVEDISQQTGIPGGALRSTPEATRLLQDTAETGVVNPELADAATKSVTLQRELQASLVPGVDIDPITGDMLSWKAIMAFSNTSDARLLQDALNEAPGFQLPGEPQGPQQPEQVPGAPPLAYQTMEAQQQQQQQQQQGPSPYTGGYYEGPPAGYWAPPPVNYMGMPTSSAATARGNNGVSLDLPDEMPQWVWLAAAAAGLFMLSR